MTNEHARNSEFSIIEAIASIEDAITHAVAAEIDIAVPTLRAAKAKLAQAHDIVADVIDGEIVEKRSVA